MENAQTYVYLNEAPIRDIPPGARLRVADVLREYGMDPDHCDVFRLRSRHDPTGDPASGDDEVPTGEEVYYRAVPRGGHAPHAHHNPGPHMDVPQSRRNDPMGGKPVNDGQAA